MNAPIKTKPLVDPRALELATFGRTWSNFRLRTTHRLEDIAAPGYFDPAMEAGIRVGDIIDIMAGAQRTNMTGRLTDIDGVVFAKVAIARIGPATEAPQQVSVRPLVAYWPPEERKTDND